MFSLELIIDKVKCGQIKSNAQFEIYRLGRRKDFIISSSASSSQTHIERQSSLVKFQADLDQSTARHTTMQEGKEKSKLAVDIKELEWKVLKLSLSTTSEGSAEEIIQEAFEIEKINVTITLFNTFVTALEARIAQL